MINELYSNSKVMVKCFLLLTAGFFMSLSRGDVVEALDVLFFAARACWTATVALRSVLAFFVSAVCCFLEEDVPCISSCGKVYMRLSAWSSFWERIQVLSVARMA